MVHSNLMDYSILFLLLLISTLTNGSFIINRNNLLQKKDTNCKQNKIVDQIINKQHKCNKNVLFNSLTIVDDVSLTKSNLDIVLLGIGDLRVDDHGGFEKVFLNNNINNKVLPIFILTDDMIENIPGIRAHTFDTANLLASAIEDINDSLKRINPELTLHYTKGSNLFDSLNKVVAGLSASYDKVRIHVCDLGDADNSMGYGPYSQLTKKINEKDTTTNSLTIVPWSQSLRNEPWNELLSLPELYPEYESKYISSNNPIKPIDMINTIVTLDQIINLPTYKELPNGNELLLQFTDVLKKNINDMESLTTIDERIEAEQCSGMYMSHWGGLPTDSIKSTAVLSTLKLYAIDCQENDQQWMQQYSKNSNFIVGKCKQNIRSLEHSAMIWQLQVDSITGLPTNTNNWLAGESMIRYLAAPLLFGTISSRRVWYTANENPITKDWFRTIIPLKSSLKDMVENGEWHRLFAAKNIRTDPACQGNGLTTYNYWRYQGFLCRYAITDFIKSTNDVEAVNKEGILLVHGFGASGAQWNKAMQEITKLVNEESTLKNSNTCQGLAPDLIGFGHSEKPSVSYTGYMWDAQMMDFCKEIAIGKYNWNSFITGGNSIGGFTSLSLAASDSASIDGKELSSSGAPGTQKCSGLVLMNSAGPIKTMDEITKEAANDSSSVDNPLSVAQVTSLGRLPTCKPPARPIARAFGNVLLGYLQPQIQSICKNLYPTNPSAVDKELCDSILRDSLDPGAINVMMAGAKLPLPRTANELLAADFGRSQSTSDKYLQESCFTGPVLIAQGVLDPLNDAKDRMKRFESLRSGIIADPIQAGHCPHDELPDQVAKSIVTWMNARPVSSFASKTTSPQVSTIR